MSLSLGAAFLAGFFSFLSPCVLPLLPTYLLYLGGERGRPFRNAVFFVLGFGVVFFLLGLPFTLLGGLLAQYRPLLAQVGGVLLILFGLWMLGLRPRLHLGLAYQGDAGRPLGAFLLGLVLALGWTPCIGPVLGAVLTLTALGQGIGLLLAYILGLALPFLLFALFADRLEGLRRRAVRLAHALEVLAGVVLVLVGLLLLLGAFTLLNNLFIRLTPEWLLRYL